MKTINQILIVLLFSTCACGNRSSKVAENTTMNDSTLHILDENIEYQINDRERENLNKVIANFYKYKNEELLFEGIENYGFIDMEFSDILLIFNFEKGTVKMVNRNRDERVDYFNYIIGFPKESTITGDFNGDGKKDSLMLENFELLLQQHVNYKIDGFSFVFSDKTISNLDVSGNLQYIIKNEGDLDGDGGDEIGFLYGWYTSGCRNYNVFTLKNNQWENLIEVESTLDMRRAGIVPVEKDPEQEGVILIRSSADGAACCCTPYVVEKSLMLK